MEVVIFPMPGTRRCRAWVSIPVVTSVMARCRISTGLMAPWLLPQLYARGQYAAQQLPHWKSTIWNRLLPGSCRGFRWLNDISGHRPAVDTDTPITQATGEVLNPAYFSASGTPLSGLRCSCKLDGYTGLLYTSPPFPLLIVFGHSLVPYVNQPLSSSERILRS